MQAAKAEQDKVMLAKVTRDNDLRLQQKAQAAQQAKQEEQRSVSLLLFSASRLTHLPVKHLVRHTILLSKCTLGCEPKISICIVERWWLWLHGLIFHRLAYVLLVLALINAHAKLLH